MMDDRNGRWSVGAGARHGRTVRCSLGFLAATTSVILAASCGYRAHRDGGPPDGDGGGGGCEPWLPECQDFDGDGHGIGRGCCGDCNDFDPEVWDDCCERDPHWSGCPCDYREFPEPETCYEGPAGTDGVGICQRGLRQCLRDEWGPCNDQVLPREEFCDGIDDDCNGTVDDGQRNECGTCNECHMVCTGRGEGCSPWRVEEQGQGVEPSEEEMGCLGLGPPLPLVEVVWIPNTTQGTISKIDVGGYEEEGRYVTSPAGLGRSSYPSRTDVDYEGAVVVTNQAWGSQASVTRIAAQDCPDADRNGRVVTSSGRDDVLDWGDDECVLWNTDVGCAGAGCGVPRAVAVEDRVGLDGVLEPYVWVGLYNERRYVELDRTHGEETGEEANVSPCTPYGAAVDWDGNLWSACISTNLVRFDTSDTDDMDIIRSPGATYGVALDLDGNVWTSGACQRFEPFSDEFTSIPGCNTSGGIVSDDLNGYIFFGSCWAGGGGGTCRVDTDSLGLDSVAASSYGVTVDNLGMVWAVPMTGYVDLIDPRSLEVERILNDCDGGPCLEAPDALGRLTRIDLRNAVQAGEYDQVFELPCESGVEWVAVTWEATPNTGTIAFAVRSGDSFESLAAQPWEDAAALPGAEPPASLMGVLDEPSARYIEVRAQLQRAGADRDSPVLCMMGLQYACWTGP